MAFLTLLMGSSVLLAVSMTIENALRANKNTTTPMLISAVVTAVKISTDQQSDVIPVELLDLLDPVEGHASPR